MRAVSALFLATVVVVSSPILSGQETGILKLKHRPRARPADQVKSSEAQKTALAREIIEAREALTGRGPFAPAFTAYWVDRLSKLSPDQLLEVAALGADSDLEAAVATIEPLVSGSLAAGEPAAAFGDSGASLVFTKVTPCRVVDTRTVANPIPSAGSRSYAVAGTTGFAAQGGNATGCGVPLGATAVALNVTVTGTAGGGWLRAWPWGATPATASIINFDASTSALANGLILPICDPAAATCTYDLTVTADAAGTHAIIDVMGYFIKPSALGILKTFTTVSTSDATTQLPELSACINYSGGSVSVNAPGPGQIVVEAKVQMLVSHTAGTSELAFYGIATSGSSCTGSGFVNGNGSFVLLSPPSQPTGDYYIWDVVTLTYAVTSPGPITFYLNGFKDNGTIGSIHFYFSGMKATFQPQ